MVYLTIPEENEVWLKIRVLDEDGQLLGETYHSAGSATLGTVMGET